MKLRPYQETAVDFLYSQDKAMILAPVGAGKTAIALTTMRDMIRDGHAKRFLVLAPLRVATSVWPKESKLWASELSLAVCVGTLLKRTVALRSTAQIVVANYDSLQWLTAQSLDFDAVVFDELTRLKNPSGTRFKALHKIIEQFPIRWGLTGSFTSNGLEDVFGQCKIINQTLLGRSKGAFQQQYFTLTNPEFGTWEPRKGSLEQVMERIKPATFLLDPGEYQDKLPPLHTVKLECEMPMDDYKEMKKEFVLKFPDTAAVAANAGVVTSKLQQMASGFVYITNKTPSAVPGKYITTQTPRWLNYCKLDLLDDLLTENQHANTIIAYQYSEELAELQRRYPQAATLDSPNVIDLWNDGKIELLLVHPKSAGHGLNLQFGGCRIVFLSLPWSLELYEQTIGRLHRSGQRHDVWCYVLTTANTVDEQIWAALQNKRSMSDIAMEVLR